MGAAVARLGACALAVAVAAGCENDRSRAISKLTGKSPKERAEGVRELGKQLGPREDDLWRVLVNATRDAAKEVRVAAAETLRLAPQRAEDELPRADADDALAALLADPDDEVRIAAAGSLGEHCGTRPVAYLHGAMTRSDVLVRLGIVEALHKCKLSDEEILTHAAGERRRNARVRLESEVSGLRVWGTRELGLLGTPDDLATLVPLIDDKDGQVAAAAIAGLGAAGAPGIAPRLVKLVSDPAPAVAAAAAQAVLDLGPEAVKAARPALERQVLTSEDPALPSALALVSIAGPGELCGLARQATLKPVAAALARGCPPGPFADELGRLLKSAEGQKARAASEEKKAQAAYAAAVAQARKKKLAPPKPPAPAEPQALEGRFAVLLEALAQAAPGKLTPAQSSALAALVRRADPILLYRALEVAVAVNATEAGPAALELARRDLAAVQAERKAASERRLPAPDTDAAAREILSQAAQVPMASREKIQRLLELVKKHDEGRVQKLGAREQLDQLLSDDPVRLSRGALIAQELRAARTLGAKGLDELAKTLTGDPDAQIAAAARNEPAPAPPQAPQTPVALQARVVTLPGDELAQARGRLWSDLSAERSEACSTLAAKGDAQSAALRAVMASFEPELRVRLACATKKETAPQERR
ncbi:MAG: HEAT repeat domain-containing protein [Deltaproteobacteria bacterium]|nr:HEAT repeat domain-containing protein [Deltaproteobacteria bacterium]